MVNYIKNIFKPKFVVPVDKSVIVKNKDRVVVFKEAYPPNEAFTYTEFYSVHICPKCKHILNHDRARYSSKCCYYCGHSNCSTLFTPEKVVVRDKYLEGNFIETIAK